MEKVGINLEIAWLKESYEGCCKNWINATWTIGLHQLKMAPQVPDAVMPPYSQQLKHFTTSETKIF